MPKVLRAQPYRSDAMWSLGDAVYMFIRQFQFPNEYSQEDKITSADSDRLIQQDIKHASDCFKKHTGSGELNSKNWFLSAFDEGIMNFLKEILKADSSIQWTGYRILGSVHQGNGFPVWTLELFAKHPSSKTKVYTGSDAPNVMIRKSTKKNDIHFFNF